MMTTFLPDDRAFIDMVKPCGPVRHLDRALGQFQDMLGDLDGVSDRDFLVRAEAALLPIMGASSYLSGVMRRDPRALITLLQSTPKQRFDEIMAGLDHLINCRNQDVFLETDLTKSALRQAKTQIHLLCALGDLGGVLSLEAVCGSLSRFADKAVALALCLAVDQEIQKSRLLRVISDRGPVPGLFIVAMGKHGAYELNYSSDIDITFFAELSHIPVASGADASIVVDRLAKSIATTLSERTMDGYVFRVDLRLRPDPSSTPSVVSVPFALHYYETVGQNWERAAMIKARPIAGDFVEAEGFLQALKPFVWRRSLDFPAIDDVQSIMRQIHIHRASDRLSVGGANLKLGVGGIRQIEFFVQTQQLILGGRDPSLRHASTLNGLEALRVAGHIGPVIAKDLSRAYRYLRNWEHRVQMLNDEQTHDLPVDPDERLKVAALSGVGQLARFDAQVEWTLTKVNAHYSELFSAEESLASRFGNLVFTGVDHDPMTLKTLERLGFDDPYTVSSTIRSWHHGRIGATRSQRGREIFTRLVPRLLEALHNTGNPQWAFTRFSVFFSSLNAGVQVQSLFLANPHLFRILVETMGLAPRLARTLGTHPTVFDAMLDSGFFEAPGEEIIKALAEATVDQDLEISMNGLRRVGREQQFRLGMQILNHRLDPEVAGASFTRIADTVISLLAPLCHQELNRTAGKIDGDFAVLGMGTLGAQEMHAASDLDIMLIYKVHDPLASSALKGFGAETFYMRLTQKLIASLSAPTYEGRLYDIDLKLRPSGSKGPVAVSLGALINYYETEAQGWELMALTKARLIVSSSESFGNEVRSTLSEIMRKPRDLSALRDEMAAMRALIIKERPPSGLFDLKLSRGGQMECEFVAQYLQLAHAAEQGPLRTGTLAALSSLIRQGLGGSYNLENVRRAWHKQQAIKQFLRVCLEPDQDPIDEPEGFHKALARTIHARRFDTLQQKLQATRASACEVIDDLFGSSEVGR
jgi:glutamate-ammonia-ligase adenylyltransferase